MIPNKDRIPAPGKEGWRKLTVVDAGSSGLPVGAEIKAKVEYADEATQEGKPYNKAAMDEILAASGETSGTAEALILDQPGFVLQDGAVVRIKLHTDMAAGATLNVNGTGAKAIKYTTQDNTDGSHKAGSWLQLIYSSSLDAYTFQAGGASPTPPGYVLFEDSGIFDPTVYGLKVGDIISVTCIGGGGGGGGAGSVGGTAYTRGGDAGKGGKPYYLSAGGSGGGGAGYGGGGGGGAGYSNGDDYFSGGSGGGAGRVVSSSVVLSSLTPIPVTVGAAGKGFTGTSAATAGGASSFGSYVSASGGTAGANNGGSPGTGGSTGGRGGKSTSTNYYSGGGGGGGGGVIIIDGRIVVLASNGGNGGNAPNENGASVTGTGGGGGGARASSSGGRLGGTSVYGGQGGDGWNSRNGADGGSGKGCVLITWGGY